jgi:serine/threonine protein kinase
MELMDDSLTHFLESSPQPIPYHIQVNVCHDITRALSFLHSNGIVHRDLSSNNVLLIGNIRAKLTDFGMARLGDLNPQATRFTNTMCPGTDVYMPPEAVQDKPVYTEKIDCFSFGVITVQTMTREFPKPGDRQITINDPRYPRPIKMNIPEIERRQNHIHEVDPNHPLLPISLNCLKDADDARPSAQQLCERIAALKKMDKYKNASEGVKNSSGDCKEREYEQIQRLQQKLEANNCIIGQKDAVIAENEQQLRQSREDNQQQSQQIQQLERDKQQLQRESSQVIEEKERQLGRLTQQLEGSEQLIADFVQKNADLEEQIAVLRSHAQKQHGGTKSARTVPVDRANIKLTWREGEKCPYGLERYDDAVCMTSYNSASLAVYCVILKSDSPSQKQNLCTYHAPTSKWSLILDHPLWGGFAIAVIDGHLTTVGGYIRIRRLLVENTNTAKLFSLSGEGSNKKWIEKFPPMPTKRYGVSTLCTGKSLIVAGGKFASAVLTTIEVLNTETQQWHTALNLPQPSNQSSLILCDDLVYLLGGYGYHDELVTSVAVYSCSLNSLLLSKSRSIGGRFVSALTRSPWKRVANLPVKASTTVILDGRLLAIGGLDAANKPITAVHTYQPTTNSWKIISHMTTPRSECLAAVLPDNQLMVVGGRTTSDQLCNSVEFGTVV